MVFDEDVLKLCPRSTEKIMRNEASEVSKMEMQLKRLNITKSEIYFASQLQHLSSNFY